MPKRIQRRRDKGWRMPEGAIYVGRPTIFGNPLRLEQALECGYVREPGPEAKRFLVECFREWLTRENIHYHDWWHGPASDEARQKVLDALPTLRGSDLACWCALDQPCHADVLLELANR